MGFPRFTSILHFDIIAAGNPAPEHRYARKLSASEGIGSVGMATHIQTLTSTIADGAVSSTEGRARHIRRNILRPVVLHGRENAQGLISNARPADAPLLP